jgi:hypothetical protein
MTLVSFILASDRDERRAQQRKYPNSNAVILSSWRGSSAI